MYKVSGSEDFDKMFEYVKKEAASGKGESKQLVKFIEKAIEKLKYNYKHGQHIAKNKIPHEYIEKYDIENLWKINLGSFWRLIYAIHGTEMEVTCLLLEVLDHKKYDRKFGYKTS